MIDDVAYAKDGFRCRVQILQALFSRDFYGRLAIKVPDLGHGHVIRGQRAWESQRDGKYERNRKVCVPVLSLQTTLTEPKVSTLGSLRTIAFL